MNDHMPLMGVNDLVINQEFSGGGFSVDSILLKSNISPIQTVMVNNEQHGGGHPSKVSELFGNLVVPNWALNYNFTPNNLTSKYDTMLDEDSTDIKEDLHNKLYRFIDYYENEKKEKNNRKTKRFKKFNKKTKHNKSQYIF